MHRLGLLHFSLVSHKPLLNPSALSSFNSCYCFSYSPDPTESYYYRLLKSCDGLASLKQIHSALTTTSLISQSPHLGAQIILRYGNFGELSCARSLFNHVNGFSDKPSSFLWNTMIRAYANDGHCFETLQLYYLMRGSGISPNNYSFPFVFKACALSSLILQGKVVHGDVLKTGFDSDVHVEAALVDMYAKCGYFLDSRKVFDEMPMKDLVCWTAMISAYEQAEKPEDALAMFQKMQQADLLADSVTIVTVASAIGHLGDAKRAQSVHAYAICNSFLDETCVGNSIIAMYMKCRDMRMARLVFDMMREKNVITWNSLLSGYLQNGQVSETLLVFDEMCDSGCKPNDVTALTMVATSAYLGARNLGRKFHDFIIESKMKVDMNLQNALMDMYAKCGDLETAEQMFVGIHLSERNASSWNVLISGYGMHGHGKEALNFFSKMLEEGVEPDHVTFTSILSACSHAGLVDEGKKCFADMKRLLVTPEVKHYACMVDLLGRAGLLQEAFNLIKEMPSPPTDAVWGALLLACKIHGNMELGEIAANNLFQLEPDHTGYYVLMSNIYAASNKWKEAAKLRQDLKKKGLKKPAAFSVIEYRKEIHGFHTADRESPYWQVVYRKVESLALEMKMVGYVADISCALHDVEDEDKEHILNYHSEKLAVAFGLMHSDPGIAIRVTKNLRVCNDCHSAFQFISFLYGRKIIVRDANRFHHFQGGDCSCKGYW